VPYIDQKARERVEGYHAPTTAGELNYLITTFVLGFLGDSPRYADFNDAIGALECAKLELYRRMIAPYEETKIAQNGDVYPPEQAPLPQRTFKDAASKIERAKQARENSPVHVHGLDCPREWQ
jgi:hypothetical protein